jgi:acetyl-CoA carboxylase carboxyltransferase component
MGAAGAVNIIFRNDIKAAEDKEAMAKQRFDEYTEEFASPYQAAKRGMVDDVIEPKTTRQRLADAFNMLEGKREKLPAKKHGNIPL